MQNGDEPSYDSQASLNPEAAALLRVMPEQAATDRHYEIGRVVNRGGMGEIHEARQTSIRRTVAMKVMLGPASEEAMARFVEEGRITGQLEHPNIVPVHEIGVDEQKRLFYTMKFVQGFALQDALTRLRQREPKALQRFSLAELLNVFQKVCDAVAFAHSKGVIHRDLKPANIMIGDFGEALVVDWGLAKKLADVPQASVGESSCPGPDRPLQTLRGSVLGTPNFMSPEQTRGDGTQVDERSDIYALGAILHALLYLCPPVAGKDMAEVFANVRAGRLDFGNGDLPHVPGGRPPESLQAVARKATALQPVDRYQTVAELQADVAAYQRGFATRAENATPWKLLTLAVRRYRREAALSAFALAALAALAAYYFVKLAVERNRAEAAFNELRGAAPAFVAQAQAFALREKFADALERLDYALKLRPEPEYFLAKANLLQSCLDFEAAARAYRAIDGPLRAEAQKNAAMSDRLAREKKETGDISRTSLAELFEIMMKEQRPASELMPMARLLGREREFSLNYWTQRLRELPFSLDPPIEKRLIALPDGMLRLDLSATAISDLRAISGMPVSDLDLSHCTDVSDLTPLRHAPLTNLDLSHTAVTDLSPLRSCPLQSLSIRDCAVTDINVLGDLPLLWLDASQTEISDFSPLARTQLESLILKDSQVANLSFVKGLPLKLLRLDRASVGGGFSTLSSLASLETLILPQNWLQLPAEEISSIRRLSTHRNLKQLSDRPMGRNVQNADTAEKFWKEWGADLVWIERLLRTGVQPKLLTKGTKQTWEIDLNDTRTDDISALAGVQVSKLIISTTSVKDLSPLAGAPLESLDLRSTPIENIEALRGMPLQKLYLHNTRVNDFAPLSTLRELQLLDVSVTTFSDLSILDAPGLSELRIGSTLITDLSPISRFPVQKLHCDNIKVNTLAPLLNVPTLVSLIPPQNVPDIIRLRALPNLKRISYDWNPNSEPKMSAEDFWQSLNGPLKDPD